MEPYPAETRNGVEVIRFFPRNLYWTFDRATKSSRSETGGRVRTIRWHLRDAWNRDASRRAAVLFSTEKLNLLHTHVIDGISATIWRFAKRRNMPVVHTAHDYHLLCPRAFMLSPSWRICKHPTTACQLYRSWHLRTTREVDLFASPSQFLLNLHRKAGLRSKGSAVVANGIPLANLNRDLTRRPRRRFIILSQLVVHKGIRVAIEAMSRLPSDLDIELVIGGRGPLEQEVRAAASMDPRIRFLGFLSGDKKREALLNADFMLLPSLWYENAPVVILEAAEFGLPMIASHIGGIPEFLREGRTGMLVPPGDASALANAMCAMAGDTRLITEFAQHAGALIARSSVPQMVDAYLNHYRRLCPGVT
jgi:glycosyltransferase involved in cell wall biosynthesis